MNVYDFDNTIYDGDSTIDFYLFCLRKKPYIIIYLFKQMFGMLLYIFKKIDKTKMKEMFFSFIKIIPTEEYVSLFWNTNEEKIKEWYIEQKNIDDVVISASPKFLIEPICNRKGISNVLASEVDPKNGKFISINCYGEEKLIRFSKAYDINSIDKFYTDSKSDLPLAKIAKSAYMVNKNSITKWYV